MVGIRLGKYVGNTSVDAAFFKTYYPSVEDESKAIPVEVKRGNATENINFTLAKKYEKREVKGRVFFGDGRPAAKVNVRYVAQTPDFKDSTITFIKTDERGRFSFIGYENHEYLIGAFTDRRDGNEHLEAFAKVISLLPKKEIEMVNLILNHDGTKKCEKCGDFLFFSTIKPGN